MPSSDIKQEKNSDSRLREIFTAFTARGRYVSSSPFGNGHIHDTYLVGTDGPERYILQKLNNNVFRRIPEMQENIDRVTGHIRKKLLLSGETDIDRKCLTFLRSSEGKSWISDSDGSFWRMSVFIPDHRSYEKMDSPEKAVESGKAIGHFQAMLSDLGGEPLHETIPDFQNVVRRLETFHARIAEDPSGRVKEVRDEIAFLDERAEGMKIIITLGNDGIIPKRITHNDTKFNNILLDSDDRALCLIDLDTVMPGYVHYDFGDAMRTGANMGDEDDPDLSNVVFNIDIYKAFAEGYISQAGRFLEKSEIEYLPLAPLLITYTQAVRFLTDYIDGDRYYKIHHHLHNLQRTRAQIQLIRSMEEQYQLMIDIIRSLTSAG